MERDIHPRNDYVPRAAVSQDGARSEPHDGCGVCRSIGRSVVRAFRLPWFRVQSLRKIISRITPGMLYYRLKETTMKKSTKNRSIGKARQAKGKIKEAAGTATGNRRMARQGRAGQAVGRAQEKVGRVQRTVEEEQG